MKTNKELMVEVCKFIDANGGKDMSVILAISDASGTASTIRPSKKVEAAEVKHLETALLVLCGVFYKRFIMPETSPSEFAVANRPGDTIN